jgi:anti-sigma28 factor (negative regulator of flagellin synthesis)
MSISPIGPNSPITRLHGSTAVQGIQGSQDVGKPSTDTVEISDVARYLSEIKKLPEIRQDKVNAARMAIAAGNYDTPDKLDKVVEGLAEDLR